MLNFVTRHMTGYVALQISGPEKERLLNLAVKSGLRFWGYRREGESYLLRAKPGDVRRLWLLKHKCKVKIKLRRKRGLPFLLAPCRGRVGLLLGAALGLLLVVNMSGRVWVLDTEGSQIYSEKQILAAAQEAGVYIGASFQDFDPVVAANSLMLKLSETEWISVNTDGVTATVAVKDSQSKPEIYEEEGIKNVVAERTGVVRSVEAQQGMVSVKINEGVRKGQLLIAGVWESYNRWGEKTGHTFTAPARGIVMAETNRDLTLSLPLRETVYEEMEETDRYSLSFFGLQLPLSLVQLPTGEYKKTEEENPLYLMGTKMPISLHRETFTRVEEREKEWEEEELEKKLMQMLRQEQEEELGENGSVLSEEIQFETTETEMILSAQCVCLEDIGEQVPVLYN